MSEIGMATVNSLMKVFDAADEAKKLLSQEEYLDFLDAAQNLLGNLGCAEIGLEEYADRRKKRTDEYIAKVLDKKG